MSKNQPHPEPTVSVKVRESTLRKLRIWCAPRGAKLSWAFDQAVNAWIASEKKS